MATIRRQWQRWDARDRFRYLVFAEWVALEGLPKKALLARYQSLPANVRNVIDRLTLHAESRYEDFFGILDLDRYGLMLAAGHFPAMEAASVLHSCMHPPDRVVVEDDDDEGLEIAAAQSTFNANGDVNGRSKSGESRKGGAAKNAGGRKPDKLLALLLDFYRERGKGKTRFELCREFIRDNKNNRFYLQWKKNATTSSTTNDQRANMLVNKLSNRLAKDNQKARSPAR